MMARSSFARIIRAKTQQGFTLIVVLIVLVAMMLAAISLVSSTNTASMIAGNMAFRQAALHAGDVGTETAIAWLQKNAGTSLWEDSPANGYHAQQLGPDSSKNQTWDDYWKATSDLGPVKLDIKNGPDNAVTYTVSYVIHRLCNAKGDPTGGYTNCALAPMPTANAGNSKDAGTVPIQISDQQYYRITSRIDGPRNTVSYVQTIVAL